MLPSHCYVKGYYDIQTYYYDEQVWSSKLTSLAFMLGQHAHVRSLLDRHIWYKYVISIYVCSEINFKLSLQANCDVYVHNVRCLCITEFGSSHSLYLNECWPISVCTRCTTTSNITKCYICLHKIPVAFWKEGKLLIYCWDIGLRTLIYKFLTYVASCCTTCVFAVSFLIW